MAGYLLLRDNKESGPYTRNDLLQLGLKPYDLIWVQGKSAAWRYPSEIEEFKSFAPAVEEQPFDRFYKKNKAENEEVAPVAESSPSSSADSKETPAISDEYSRYMPAVKEEETKLTRKKSVFVTMPGQKQVMVKNENPPAPPTEPVKPSPAPAPSPISITENPAIAEIKYSQPLDDIKEMYVKTLLDRKDKRAKKAFIIGSLKKVAVVGGLIGMGVLAGFLFTSKSKKENSIAQKHLPATPMVANNNVDDLSYQPSANNDEGTGHKAPVEKIDGDEDQAPRQAIKESARINGEQEAATVRIRKETMLIVPREKKRDFPSGEPAFTQQPSETDPVTGERNARMRSAGDLGFEDKVMVKSVKKSLHDLVSVTTNDYKRVAFGGIRNLYLTVTNHSKYELDNVIVELQYLKPSEEPLRTENVRFRSVAPNASSTIRIPDTNRGIKVIYKIINIDSKHQDGVALKY